MAALALHPTAARIAVPAQRTRRPARATGLRVRWDRVGVAVGGAVLLVWLLVGGLAGASQADAPPPPAVHVVVQPGDTLWDLARQHAPAGTATLEYVALVEQVNDVRAGALRPGVQLELPQG